MFIVQLQCDSLLMCDMFQCWDLKTDSLSLMCVCLFLRRIPWFSSTGHVSTSAEPQLEDDSAHLHIHMYTDIGTNIRNTNICTWTYSQSIQIHIHTYCTYVYAHEEEEKRFKCIFVQPVMKRVCCYGKEVLCFIDEYVIIYDIFKCMSLCLNTCWDQKCSVTISSLCLSNSVD